MRLKWLQNKLTFVIIPEANGSVMRVKMSRGGLYSALLGVILLLGTASYLYGVYFHSAAAAQLTEARVNDQTSRLVQDLSNKNKTIDHLQNEVFQLSRQAAEVRSQMEQMKQLEQELKKLTSMKDIQTDSGSDAAVEVVQTTGGMGGPAHPVTMHQMNTLVHSANANYIALKQEIAELQARWTQSKQSILAKQDQLQRIPSLWPTHTKTITSAFGYRKDPFTDKLSFHRGIDIAGKMNDPIYASAKGTAITVGYDKFHGHNIVIDHGNGVRTWYMHLNSILVESGDRIEPGQQIGKLGTSGRSTGPHLHYEILHNGKSTDPKPYLPNQ
ncbi:peptidoglycan DD-metalloendopeptidase family protein [Paenibacillus sp. LMG 31456]|uniref:Peptidoglycan DD-metalloendopeptidase family protein n=1 Tax=Paenibacillus foliorum TaxID=2654974 RepID=A0A972GXC6_9BACL|nr:M23 family metallopeptidase [Paenibacillus foliorum]NOU94605.1 peptidoglycan DD-metalloendopeptidase family protein [Paenibacillus foliorum]